MIVLLDTSQDLDTCAHELGCGVGQLLTPLTRFRWQSGTKPWAIDNGGYSRFDENAFMSLLEREKYHQDECLFVTAPDVVASARRTLEIFDRWKARLSGWKIAVAIQDGQQDLPIPWDEIEVVFIGGSNDFKGKYVLYKCTMKRENKRRDRQESKKPAYFAGRFAFFFDFGLCGAGGVASILRNTSSSFSGGVADFFAVFMVES